MTTFWERAAYSVEHMFSLYFDYLLFWLFPDVVLMVRFGVLIDPVLVIACLGVRLTGYSANKNKILMLIKV